MSMSQSHYFNFRKQNVGKLNKTTDTNTTAPPGGGGLPHPETL